MAEVYVTQEEIDKIIDQIEKDLLGISFRDVAEPTPTPLLTPEGLRFVISFLRSAVSPIKLINKMPYRTKKRNVSLLIKEFMTQLYLNWDIYFSAKNSDVLSKNFRETILIVKNFLLNVYMSDESPDLFDKLEKITKNMKIEKIEVPLIKL